MLTYHSQSVCFARCDRHNRTNRTSGKQENFMLIRSLYVAFLFQILLPPFTCYNSISNANNRFFDSFSLACSKKDSYGGMKKVTSSVEHVRNHMSDAAVRVSCLAALYLSELTLDPTAVAAATKTPDVPSRGFQTKSGLKYFDAIVGTGTQPKYGQVVSFQYIMYYRPTGGKLEIIDSTNEPFLHKHGNGRICRGVDEAIHTMNVGGRRRAIIPPNLGYTQFGIGPLPLKPKNRRRLGEILDLVDQNAGELIFDIELLLVTEDENDQGYYEDYPVTQDEVRKIASKSRELSL